MAKPRSSSFYLLLKRFTVIGVLSILALGWLASEKTGTSLFGASEITAPAHLVGFDWVAFPGPNGTSKEAFNALVAFSTEEGEQYIVHAWELGPLSFAQREAYRKIPLEAVYDENSPGTARIQVHHRLPIQKTWFFPFIFVGMLPFMVMAVLAQGRRVWRLSCPGAR